MRQRRPFAWCAASISVRDSALVIPMEIVVADVRDLAVALVGRAVDSVVFGLAAVAPHLLGGKAAHFAFISSKVGGENNWSRRAKACTARHKGENKGITAT
jgi:hypothetical protein